MSAADYIKKNAKDSFSSQWTVRNELIVPAASDLKLANEAFHFENATILYADLDGSTDLIEKKSGRLQARCVEHA